MSLTQEERRENHNAANAAWRAKNPNYFKDWADQNVEHLAVYQQDYYKNVRKANPEKLDIQRKKAKKTYKDKIIKILGGACAHCGLIDQRVLCVDHINGDGGKERRELGYWAIMRSIVKHGAQGKYQLLCMNCNHLKRLQNKEHGKGKPYVADCS